jgi:hypothetical protein
VLEGAFSEVRKTYPNSYRQKSPILGMALALSSSTIVTDESTRVEEVSAMTRKIAVLEGGRMRRSALLVMVVALTTLLFAPVAMAQDDNPSADDRGADHRGMDNRGFDDNGGGVRTFDDNPGADDRGFNDRGFDDNPTGADDVMASPAASASAASGAASTASAATATATATSGAGAGAGADDVKASVGDALPNTGGPSPVALVSAAALVLLVGSGLVATRLVRAGR